jgi:hypothetical protein
MYDGGMRMRPLVVLLLASCPGGAATTTEGGTGADNAWCKPNAEGLTGSKTVKVDTGMNYTPQNTQGVIINTRARFLDRMQRDLEGSALSLVEAQGVAPDILMTAGVQNDGSETYRIEVTCYVGSRKFYFLQDDPYTDVLKAIDDAADQSAGYLRDGWSCN